MNLSIMTLLLCVTIAFFLQGCAGERYLGKLPITQGVTGTVVFWKGDFMPGRDREGRPDDRGGGKIPVVRQLFIYALTNMKMVERAPDSSPFYSQINSELIATATSDTSGFFQAELPPGMYSCFVREETGLYANLFDGNGNIFPFEVIKDSITHIVIDITYEATF